MSEGGSGPEAQPGSPADKAPARVLVSESEMGALSPAEWCGRWRQQDAYIAALERRLAQQEGELEDLRQTTDKTRNQLNESQQRERVLMRRLTAKEQETQDYVCQLNELKSAQAPSALRSTLLDPAVNCILQQLKTELQSTRSELEDTKNELTAWKFTPDSNTGKRLMAKCRLLYQENEELGKITSSGRIAKLESDLALQKSFSEEVRQSQNELDAFLADLDEDVEGMQSTILFLQTELRKTKESAQVLQKENSTLKLANGRSNGDSVCEQERTDSDSEAERTTCVKRVRRSSVLSIDYNEDDALVISTNGDVAMASDPE
ncbi:pre-mRNA-splicing regulator female-lethal(2)D [Tribolium castaneum]|uniref:Pre-mRNA-splicing regulator female-lethal(2)D-like Protein n=1 Tax=Tribolium castaneum TaxID=7070 RepID=D6WWM9_TRICA|nr:PREDICTED: pre-mRNA-splicing regulator female-lethal(2)D [Tribolium castaneum]EFA08115.1 Pre-mRNA-splicing regulator female-lethal(2)D-like Protein [Tribolium castaneum]|eukprot:XP_008196848.1 PREDICTED: pre-mRNA-splicing regulator female-lethal(2)D [Tribolium castaneum]